MVVGREEVAEVARWAEGIERVHECIASRFRRPEPRRRALDYLRGLLSRVERKNGWQLAEQAGDAGSRLSGGDQTSGDGTGRKGGHYGPDKDLIPMTVPEVRRLLTLLVWTESQPADFILYWSRWRRRHQARARQCHYKRRLSHLRL